MNKHLTNLKEKIGHHFKDEFFKKICIKAKVVKLKKGENLSGLKTNKYAYFISTGSLIRKVVTAEGEEKVVMFHTTDFYFFTGFYDTFLSGKPSIFNLYAQENTVLIKFQHTDIHYWRDTSVSFLRYNIHYIERIHIATEMLRVKSITHSPKKYLKWLHTNHPDFFKGFTNKTIASFMGITPVHFSNLKKELFS